VSSVELVGADMALEMERRLPSTLPSLAASNLTTSPTNSGPEADTHNSAGCSEHP
jgi:hypothetical protein